MAALEDYAIEASIAKVLGSESLAWIADQGVQVYGGYGFTEECPLAGVYRDTRIDRLFEGTNEINRNVIYGYFLKKALMDQLPLRQLEKAWTEAEPPVAGREWGVQALDVVRRLTVKCLHQAICLYGQDLRNEQVVGEDLADLIIGYFGTSAALNRLLQRRRPDEKASQDRGLELSQRGDAVGIDIEANIGDRKSGHLQQRGVVTAVRIAAQRGRAGRRDHVEETPVHQVRLRILKTAVDHAIHTRRHIDE